MLELFDSKKRKIKSTTYFKRYFNEDNINRLRDDLQDLDWSYLLDCNTDTAVSSFTETLSKHLNKIIPNIKKLKLIKEKTHGLHQVFKKVR